MITVPEHILQAQDNYLKGIATEAEKEQLEQWFQQNDATVLAVFSPHSQQEALTRSENFTAISRQLQLPATSASVSIKRNMWPAAGVAAALILLVSSAGIYYYTKNNTGKTGNTATAGITDTTVTPGSSKATLTLFNGNTIVLDAEKTALIAQENQAFIHLSQTGLLTIKKRDTRIGIADATLNTLTVPNGGEFKMELPDGSSVRLNAGSWLRFPTAFTGATREVELEGEAYFDIATNKSQPFQVKAGGANVTVLGTRFTISAYKAEPQVTTLLSGRVKVQANGSATDAGKTLQPGQQATLQPNGQIHVAEVDTTDAAGWTNNMFVFNELPVNAALAQLARWYNLTVTYKKGIPDIVLNGSFPRNQSLAETLEILKKLNVHFTIENRKMVVMPL